MALIDKKYVLDDGRHFENSYEDYSEKSANGIIDGTTNEIHETFKKKLLASAVNLMEKLQENEREWYNRRDGSIYTGNAGIAQLFYRAGQILSDTTYVERAKALIEKSLSDGRRDESISYLAGNAGPLALGAAIHHASKNESKATEMVSNLESMEKNALSETSNELLYGKIGYLYALLFINANISPRPIERELIQRIISRILKDGRAYAKAYKFDTPLMYQWHEKEYIGGAHGLAGILYVLLQAREYLTKEQLEQDVRPSLNYLMKIRFPSGNFPSSTSSRSDKLVHWCHGAPSMTMLFTLASEVFDDETFLRVATECGEVVWARGLLKKGYSLCHGVSGNAYTFIALYQRTKHPKHLYRACKFSEWCMEWGKRADNAPDRPFSLFEGLAGNIYLLMDLCQPCSSKFPGYTL